MRYQLIKPVVESYSAIEQILYNRGIPPKDFFHYMNTSDNDVNSPLAFGEDVLKDAGRTLIETISNNKKVLIIVDSDCDGFTSSAVLINYLYDIFPAWTKNCLSWFLHKGKEHGLADVVKEIDVTEYSLIICPDAASNDYEEHLQLSQKNIPVIVLDHHEAEKISDHAIVINNQLCDYPNKELSGVGVVWQFCKYLDSKCGKNYADNYLDLVALGLTADMMSLQSFETKHLINKGFEDKNIKNPFIYEMAQKNKFSLGEHITPMGAAFYIAPFVNSMVRSGTQDEKELLFKSMLKMCAFERILSNKKGHKLGEEERLVDQAIRTATNVKNRQTKAQDNGLEFLEKMINERKLLNHKVLLFLLNPGQVDKNIAGLIANKFMAKYQRPCCILTKVVDGETVIYQGSARGCDKTGVINFKDICEATGVTTFATGHQGAFGLGIKEEDIETFIQKTDEALKDISDEPIYFVDYIYDNINVTYENILEIGQLDNLWGKNMDESLVAIKNLQITKDMVTIYEKSTNTLKITLPNKITLMKFKISEEEYDTFIDIKGYITINVVGTCMINEWCGNTTPQIKIEDWEQTSSGKYIF